MLRLTRMPAVRVEMGYLSNPGDRAALLDPAFRNVVAEGMLVAVKRLYLDGQDDQPHRHVHLLRPAGPRARTRPAEAI